MHVKFLPTDIVTQHEHSRTKVENLFEITDINTFRERSEKSRFFDMSEGVFSGISVGRLTRNEFSKLSPGRTALFDMVHPRKDATRRRRYDSFSLLVIFFLDLKITCCLRIQIQTPTVRVSTIVGRSPVTSLVYCTVETVYGDPGYGFQPYLG
jgi:hypothetical protein